MSIDNALQSRINRAHGRIRKGLESSTKAALQLSGGKDSLACLYLARPFWKQITVVWANFGDEIPETRRQMEAIRSMVPNFLEVKGNAKSTQENIGWPVDMLPMKDTRFGKDSDPDHKHLSLIGVWDCCNINFWQPMHKAMVDRGVQTLIRGQRDNERMRNTSFQHEDIDPESSMKCVLPIHDWSSEDVFEYLAYENIELPSQYAYGLPSLDCLHCTAYLHEKESILPFLRDKYPAAATVVEHRLRLINRAQMDERMYLSQSLAYVA